MTDADGECVETLVWIDFSKDCKYINEEIHEKFCNGYEEVGRMLGGMIDNPEKFLPK